MLEDLSLDIMRQKYHFYPCSLVKQNTLKRDKLPYSRSVYFGYNWLVSYRFKTTSSETVSGLFLSFITCSFFRENSNV
jgi:hypothetical protein